MMWNWEQPHWPKFSYDSKALEPLEQQFLLQSGEFIGARKHLGPGDQEILKIELISDEAVKTSEIEGEILNRDSVQSSLRHQLGLGDESPGVKPAERGISKMMIDLYQSFAEPLADKTMFDWHAMLLPDSRDIKVVGGYRTHADAMQVVSGPIQKRAVHFEAPPSARVPREMECFVTWFNDTAPGGKTPLPTLTRAALVHLYFVCIHPFEDGNGRIGRALAEKALAQNLGQPSLIALAYTIERKGNDYYAALEHNNKDLEIDGWMKYFANTILEAQSNTIQRVDFYIAKAKFYQGHADKLNERQAKVIARMFREGIDGFKGGLSAENYISISKTSRATATRDLQDLVERSALTKTGELRHTRYFLNLPKGSSGR
ncbi:Fic family protein [Bradyrhizobium manausense]|uniref:Fic family protein n=1 Tax=Bradyrhizobium TaxID=374 RepID=UPI001BAE4CD4|nr:MULTISPECIES: Fic family protein [Bradyrhizobium]MBR0824794.1 Fic family protein [Bradyrhizobium manausense]UVO29428.1 Fic family protein [Bradyrhizobium arachidis]